MRWWRLSACAILVLLILAASALAALALHYGGSPAGTLRSAIAGAVALWGVVTAIAIVCGRLRIPALGIFAAILVAFSLWWSTIEPSNDRDWQTDVALPAYATIDGDKITVHNIRDFDYRSETDFSPRYYDRTFDVRSIESVDLITSYWMGPAIAHVMVSFGFSDGRYLAISIEARKERGEGYSSIAGFFRRYELFYVVADERDVIRLRTNYREDPPEDVYIYRVKGSAEDAQRFFMRYVEKINQLKDHPEFYNSLTTNCTNNIWLHAGVNPRRVPYSWKILASGLVPEYLYEQDRLDTSIPFDELRRRSHVNERARKADEADDFSRRIRARG
ncbi:MAG: DUF4105 domain-containing protein [Gammaproteobacteria bacterium]|nr:DUF4105 domain-containing protein [Gammaproteobacteria bacterium]